MSDNENFDRIMAGLREFGDVVAIRKRLGLTQDAFAARFGFSHGAVRDWEQQRRQPEASARVLLTVIDREPEAVRRALDLPA
jgi:putative transcriptional regulator